jgi:hypothetical protein
MPTAARDRRLPIELNQYFESTRWQLIQRRAAIDTPTDEHYNGQDEMATALDGRPAGQY